REFVVIQGFDIYFRVIRSRSTGRMHGVKDDGLNIATGGALVIMCQGAIEDLHDSTLLRHAQVIKKLLIQTHGQGLYEFTDQVQEVVHASQIGEGLWTVFIQHTSASLVIQENADPSAKHDLERWLNRLVPEGDPFYTHEAEGPDGMASRLQCALTAA